MVGPDTAPTHYLTYKVTRYGTDVVVVVFNDRNRGTTATFYNEGPLQVVTYPVFRPLPKWRIPWEEPCYWRYLRGISLTARANKQHIRKEMKWLITAKPVRAKPGTRTYFAPRSEGLF